MTHIDKPSFPIYIHDDYTDNGQSQISRLQKRGIVFEDIEKATQFFQTNLYYRFSGYTLIYEPYNNTDSDKRQHTYPDGLKFDDIKALYLFDKELRFAMLQALEEIENALKAIVCNEMCDKEQHWLHNDDLFSNWNQLYECITKALKDGKNLPFINPAENIKDIEFWQLSEVLTFGSTIKIYNLLNNPPYEKIMQVFKIEPSRHRDPEQRTIENKKKVTKTLDYLKDLRNHCAHHNRLTAYAQLQTPPNIPGLGFERLSTINVGRYIWTIDHILQGIRHPDNQSEWLERVYVLIAKYGNPLTYYKLERMGKSAFTPADNQQDGIYFLCQLLGFQHPELIEQIRLINFDHNTK